MFSFLNHFSFTFLESLNFARCSSYSSFVFVFVYLFFLVFSCLSHLSLMLLEPLEFAKCSSLVHPFLVENALKHKKSMMNAKKMMKQ